MILGLGLGAPFSSTAIPDAIRALFSSNEQGVWYDPSDMSTMYQDSAGTVPVTAVEQPVGRILDKSGRGNHAFQATATSRPTLSARYNLLQQSEATYQAPWGFVNTSGSATQTLNTYTFGSSPLDRVRQTSSAIPANTTIAASAVLSGSGTVRLVLIHGDGSGSTSLAVTLTNTPTSYVLTVSNPAAGANGGIGIYNNAAGLPGAVVNVHGTDLRPANDGVGLPSYQRVVDANTYDTVGFPLYLKFDGVDDGLRTSDIDFTAVTSLFVAAAARKLSDAARGTLCELSSSYGNPGSFALEAPGITLNSFMFAHTGATTYKALYRQLPAPVSAVVVGVSDLPSGYARLSAKSPGYAQMSDVTTDVGGGSYATASLFIGRRAGSAQPFNGRLYSLVIRGAATTDATVATVESYLNQKARIY